MRVGHTIDREAVIVAREKEVGHDPEGGGRNFDQDPEGVTASVSRKGYPTKSGYLTFDAGGMYTINWKPIGDQIPESNRPPRFEPSSDPSKKPNRLSTIPIPEEYCKMLTHTPRLGESQPKRGPNSFSQPNSLAINIDKSSSATRILL